MNENKDMIRVAYAEDQTAIRECITGYLCGDNICVVIDGMNGAELLEKLMMAERLPDVCLIDIHMPVMNGFTLLKEIRRRWPMLPCVIFTAFVNEYYIAELIRLGGNAYITKNSPAVQITEAVRTVLRQPYYYNQVITQEIIGTLQGFKHKSLQFTEREIEFLKDSCSDLSYAAIAQKWGTTYKTIDGIRERLGAKLHVRSRAGLMLVAIKLGYFTLESQGIFR